MTDTPTKVQGRAKCSIEGCEKTSDARGWCKMHWKRWKRWGDPSIVKYTGRIITPQGYVRILDVTKRQKYILEHRYIMEQYLGRYLTKKENVHHINGNKQDNRIENLELWNTSQPKGQRIEDKIQYALEILETYAPNLIKEK